MATAEVFAYQGQELDLFARAHRWKRYWCSRIRPWISGDVLEIGAGIGANTALLQNEHVRSWHCVEPDPELRSRLDAVISSLPTCSVSTGTIRSAFGRQFDTILYIDVLEHIEADHAELTTAADLLRPGGHLIVLSPAHQFLFSRFDDEIGHWRRYNKSSLRACGPADLELKRLFYLDSAGILLSLANRLLLRQATPTLNQIQAWDRFVVPVSQSLDAVLGYSIGKTIVGVWTRR
ncbi:MAG: class I SAM-dependent methyltransferase [Acidobacteriota bacterium]